MCFVDAKCVPPRFLFVVFILLAMLSMPGHNTAPEAALFEGVTNASPAEQDANVLAAASALVSDSQRAANEAVSSTRRTSRSATRSSGRGEPGSTEPGQVPPATDSELQAAMNTIVPPDGVLAQVDQSTSGGTQAYPVSLGPAFGRFCCRWKLSNSGDVCVRHKAVLVVPTRFQNSRKRAMRL